MSFERAKKTGFLANEIYPVLSPFRLQDAGILSSVMACVIHIICLATAESGMYSASVLEVAADRCFLTFHETKHPLIRTHCSEQDCLSLILNTYLASAYPTTPAVVAVLLV